MVCVEHFPKLYALGSSYQRAPCLRQEFLRAHREGYLITLFAKSNLLHFSTFFCTRNTAFLMEEILRTNDIIVIACVKTVSASSGIDVFELDVNISMMEGCVGILPHRHIATSLDGA